VKGEVERRRGRGREGRRKGLGPRKKFLVPPLQIIEEIVS